jgi:hypothetical protein
VALVIAAGSTVMAVLFVGAFAHLARDARPLPAPRSITVDHRAGPASGCARIGKGPLEYHYPVRPFLTQHPVRGNFGDPRTVSMGGYGEDSSRTPGSFSFHNGIDISAPTETPVYPVVSGTAKIRSGDEVVVVTHDARVFQYFHIRPAIRSGQEVVAYRTILGRILPHWGHVHMSEIDGFRVHNPADPGHLEPYRDGTVPDIARVRFDGTSGGEVDPRALHGQVQVAVAAFDIPPVRPPGAWSDEPVTPAVVSWRLVTSRNRVVLPWRTVFDVRRTEPANSNFWRVYAPGTFQNFPVFGRRLFWGQPGRYYFRLTDSPLDTRRFGNGNYVIDVRVADVCANWSIRKEPISIHNPHA